MSPNLWEMARGGKKGAHQSCQCRMEEPSDPLVGEVRLSYEERVPESQHASDCRWAGGSTGKSFSVREPMLKFRKSSHTRERDAMRQHSGGGFFSCLIFNSGNVNGKREMRKGKRRDQPLKTGLAQSQGQAYFPSLEDLS